MLRRQSRLDLSLPADQPLSDEERVEVKEHLGFLKRFKQALRLSFNAKEDLLVNGAKEPSERGVIKHLLSKLNRSAVEQALSREPMKSERSQRIRFLSGVVRLLPEISTLLWYLEALSQSAEQSEDRKEAARAFSLTIERLDFKAVSNAQLSSLLATVERIFRGHDRVQVALGLLANRNFADALARASDHLPEETSALYQPLRAARTAVLDGELPQDEAGRIQVDQGLKLWLSAPDRALRSYPEALRFQLVEHALSSDIDIPGALFDSLPKKSEAYAQLGLRLSEQLFQKRQDDKASALLRQLAEVHPQNAEIKKRAQALDWPQLGRVRLYPSQNDQTSQNDQASVCFHRGFWQDGSSFVWVRLSKKGEDPGRLLKEAELQANLQLFGVLPALAQGRFKEESERAFVVILRAGRPLLHELPKLNAAGRRALAYEGLLLLKNLALAGVRIPDIALRRFAIFSKSPPTLRLVDMDGAKRGPPEQCAMDHQALAAPFVESLTGEKVSPRAPLLVLAKRFALTL